MFKYFYYSSIFNIRELINFNIRELIKLFRKRSLEFFKSLNLLLVKKTQSFNSFTKNKKLSLHRCRDHL